MRYVLDTNVLVGALRSDRGASRQLLLKVLDGQVLAIASVPLMIEYEAVLTRPDQLAATGLSVEETNEVLDALALVAEPTRLRFHWRPQLNDRRLRLPPSPGPSRPPDRLAADEMVLETAVNGGADRLVTFNLRHLRAAAGRFGIQAITPPQALKEIRTRHEKK